MKCYWQHTDDTKWMTIAWTLKDSRLFQKYYGEIGNFKYYQVLIPTQLVDEVLRNLHAEIWKKPGITKTSIAYGQEHYYPKMAALLKKWVMSCDQCIEESRIDCRLDRPHRQNPCEHTTGRDNAMRVDLVPELPPYGDYQKTVKVMDVFSSYLFAYRTKNQDAKTVARLVICIMTNHANLLTTIIFDKGSTFFLAQVIEKVADVSWNNPSTCSNQACTEISMLERRQASLKRVLENETGERRSKWHK